MAKLKSDMTPEEHNKYVGYAHLGYGIFSMLLMLGLALFYAFVFGMVFLFDPKMNGNPVPFVFVIAFCVLIFVFASLFSLPSIIAGYGHLKKKSWAKVWSLIAAVLSASSFPLGTAVTVYSLWFSFGEEGRKFYEQQEKEKSIYSTKELRAATTASWTAKEQAEFKEYDFVNAPQPPNWRED